MTTDPGLMGAEELCRVSGLKRSSLRALLTASRKLDAEGRLEPKHLPLPVAQVKVKNPRTPSNPSGVGAKQENLWDRQAIMAWLPRRQRPGNPGGWSQSHEARRGAAG